MSIKLWIETSLKIKGWSLTKLRDEIQTAHITRITNDHKIKLEKLNRENISEDAKKAKHTILENNLIKETEKPGVDLSTLSRIINSDSNAPSSKTLQKIEFALGSYEEFMKKFIYNGNNRFSEITYPGVCIDLPDSAPICYFCVLTDLNYIENLENNPHSCRIIIVSNHKSKLRIYDDDSDKRNIRLETCEKCKTIHFEAITLPYSDLLRIIIKEKHFTQSTLAKALKTTQSQVFKIINERIDYLDKEIARDIIELFVKLGMSTRRQSKNEKTIEDETKYISTLNTKIIDKIKISHDSAASKYNKVNKRNYSTELDVKIISEFREKTWKEPKGIKSNSLTIYSDFYITLNSEAFGEKNIVVFKEKLKYLENLEYKYIYLRQLLDCRYICLICPEEDNKLSAKLFEFDTLYTKLICPTKIYAYPFT